MKKDKILLGHGSGGRISHQLVREVFLPCFRNPILAEFDDSAVLTIGEQRLAFSTDSYTVDPLFFPGGDIGNLAVNGTVNDLAMGGARPLYLSVGFIIEEGFAIADLERILESMKRSAEEADVLIVTGDTKVVHRGAVDKIFINTSGVGTIHKGANISGKNARPGDKIILSGHIADHGITVLTHRAGIDFKSSLQSDTAPLNDMVASMIAASSEIHTLRDPTRGGIGTSLNEIALQSGTHMRLYEDAIPLRHEVTGACELLGIDPLYVANEGKLLACVGPDDAGTVLKVMQANRYGRYASVVGEVLSGSPGKVFMETTIGGTRIIDMLAGEQLPRIC